MDKEELEWNTKKLREIYLLKKENKEIKQKNKELQILISMLYDRLSSCECNFTDSNSTSSNEDSTSDEESRSEDSTSNEVSGSASETDSSDEDSNDSYPRSSILKLRHSPFPESPDNEHSNTKIKFPKEPIFSEDEEKNKKKPIPKKISEYNVNPYPISKPFSKCDSLDDAGDMDMCKYCGKEFTKLGVGIFDEDDWNAWEQKNKDHPMYNRYEECHNILKNNNMYDN